jgi:BirA family biotin operon repressor/biotin-[acetyl-CoA-carboxylase] ligase
VDTAIHWPAEAIWEAVSPHWPTFSVEVLPEVDSTNSELMRRARAGQFDPVLLVAQRQTAGRGRLGRSWHSDAQGALTFSLGLPLQPHAWSGLSLAVGLTVAQALHPDLQLKWPNDVWLHGRKLAGILIETASVGEVRYAVIGVGINITLPDGAGLSTPPASLLELRPGIDAPGALARVAVPLITAVRRFEADGFAPLQTAFNARDALQGQNVQCSDGVVGVAHGVDAHGALLVHTPAGIKKITSAEVSVRPSGAAIPPDFPKAL